MKLWTITITILLALAAFAALPSAKRMAPKTVDPVTKDGIEYSAPLDREGFVVATWTKTKREIWCRQMYVIKHEYKLGLEADVQTCCITALELADGKIKVANEQGSEFEMGLDTMEVKVLKGKAVIDYTNAKPSGE